ncbi:hypothetical protein G6F60_014971 [Rhizopus arrhizus]|nr:hypothetical protein G6F60_014971 [Rhizopus arrhizus]
MAWNTPGGNKGGQGPEDNRRGPFGSRGGPVRRRHRALDRRGRGAAGAVLQLPADRRTAAWRGAALRPVLAHPAARPELQAAVADRIGHQGQCHRDQDVLDPGAGADP